jgi:MoaA/NifB/PqqE/SkfB family radical SAM enzyme
MKISGLHIEPTNICTLKCPRCARTIFLEKFTSKSWANQNLDLESLKKFLDIDLSAVKVLLCGNYGDPIYYPDLFSMVEYFKNKKSNITLVTNGSYKKENWWAELVSLLSASDTIIFSVDGTPDNFTQYRVNANWDSIYVGMNIVAKSNINSVWKYIPFRFNENDIEKTKELSERIGIKKFLIDPSDRWESPTDILMPNTKFENTRHEAIIEWKYNNAKNQNITPKCFQGDQHFITASGYYTPCCYSFDHRFYYKSKFYKNKNHYDISNKTLTQILQHEKEFFDNLEFTKPEFCTFNCPTLK